MLIFLKSCLCSAYDTALYRIHLFPKYSRVSDKPETTLGQKDLCNLLQSYVCDCVTNLAIEAGIDIELFYIYGGRQQQQLLLLGKHNIRKT